MLLFFSKIVFLTIIGLYEVFFTRTGLLFGLE